MTHIGIPSSKIDLFLDTNGNLNGALNSGILCGGGCSGNRGGSGGSGRLCSQGLKIDFLDSGILSLKSFEI